MTTVHSFDPISDDRATTLVLGTMPGAASLAAGRYYAHPRNSFWPIMCQLIAVSSDLEYDARTAALRDNNIAVWDVMKLCTREGSLDSAIVEDSIIVNNFAQFFAEHPSIDRVFFNGAKAGQTYRRYAKIEPPGTTFGVLPSTSPAHASMTRAEKARRWHEMLSGCRIL